MKNERQNDMPLLETITIRDFVADDLDDTPDGQPHRYIVDCCNVAQTTEPVFFDDPTELADYVHDLLLQLAHNE